MDGLLRPKKMYQQWGRKTAHALDVEAQTGAIITQTLFIGRDNILVEGPSDFLYLTWASEELKSQGSPERVPRRTAP